MKRLMMLGVLGIAVIFIFAACGNDNGNNEVVGESSAPTVQPTESAAPAPSVDPVEQAILDAVGKPVAVNVFLTQTGSTDEDRERMANAIKKEYPNISINYIYQTADIKFSNLIASGVPVDIVFSSFSSMSGNNRIGLFGDVTDLVKKYNYDLERFKPQYINAMADINDGKLPGLPYDDLRQVLFYNKEIFDKFGEPYPEDGMTWEDYYPVANRLSRTEEGVQYIPFAFATSMMLIGDPHAYSYFDTNGKPAMDSVEWSSFISKFLPLFQLPGVEDVSKSYTPTKFNNGIAAMTVNFNKNVPTTFDWDAVTVPEHIDAPGIGSQPYFYGLFLSSNSKERDAAFLAMTALTTDEFQRENAEAGRVSVLKDKKIMENFAMNNPDWKDKNWKAITTPEVADMPIFDPNYRLGYDTLRLSMNSILKSEKDINTAFRDANDELAAKIAGQ